MCPRNVRFDISSVPGSVRVWLSIQEAALGHELMIFLRLRNPFPCLGIAARQQRNFLPQVNAILEDKGDETFEELLQRQVTGDCTLPTDEDVWEVSLPTIAVTPEAQPTYMIYGYQAQSFSVGSVPQGDENPVLKSWPPKSAVDHFDIIPVKKGNHMTMHDQL
uniref:Uncharacterized protein n=1 Tax=Biomphalaria glabrata TaxID=6526 RepID=A0A2C9KIB0_BIOGL